MNVLLIGEAPGPSGKAGFDGWSGRRIARLLEEFGVELTFWNVFKKWPGPKKLLHHKKGGKGSEFPIAAARRRVPNLRKRIAAHSPHFVLLLGSRVARAFDVEGFFCLSTTPGSFGWIVPMTAIPHPSGVNRWFNDPKNVALLKRRLSNLFKAGR